MQFIFWYDWVLGFFLVVVVLLFVNKIIKNNQEDILIQKYFKPAVLLKILGALLFTIYHAFIYKDGDTFAYFLDGSSITNLFISKFSYFFHLVFFPLDQNQDIINNVNWLWEYDIVLKEEGNYFPIRLSAVIQLFTFKAYLPTCILYSLLSFWGIWKCFKCFNTLFEGQSKALAYGFLFFPTVLFWGSGISKDTICLGAICGLTAAAYNIFILKFNIFKNSIALLLLVSILFIVKPYIPLSFLPALLIAILFNMFSNIKSIAKKAIVFPIVLLLVIQLGNIMSVYITKNFEKFALENLAEKITTSNKNLQAGAGSSFDLGIKPENVTSISDFMAFFPKALQASFFRPWPWEAKNPAMLLSSMEGLFILLLCLAVLIRGKLLKPFKIIFKNPVLLSAFFYSILFGALVGLSTSNFGTLMRYKLPCMPFFVTTLFMVLNIIKKEASNKKKLIDTIELVRE
jgi:hypothetical protein